MNDYYSELINGLFLSEQQHCQLENTVLQQLHKMQIVPKKEQQQSDNDISYN